MRRLFVIVLISMVSLVGYQSHGQDSYIFHHVKEKPSQNTIIKIVQDSVGMLWMGTRYGLNRFDGRRFETYLRDAGDPNSISGNRIDDLVIDKAGNFWLGTSNGVSYFEPSKNRFTRYQHESTDLNSLSSNFVLSLCLDYKDRLWVGTEDAGLNRLDTKTGEIIHYQHNSNDPFSLSSDYITDILQDESGRLWIATFDGGLDLFDPNTSRFINYNSKNSGFTTNSIRVLEKTSNGMVVGTDDGLFQMSSSPDKGYEFQKFKFNDSISDQLFESTTVLSVLEDRSGKIWVGSENKGLFQIDAKRSSVSQFVNSRYDEKSIASNSIWSLFEDRSEILWIGSFNKGLIKIDPLHRRFRHFTDDPMSASPLSFNIISSFIEDNEGLWVGTDGGGLNFINKSTDEVRVFRNDPNDPGSLASNAVLDLLLMPDKSLWVASWEGGISILNPQRTRFRNITVQGGDPISGEHAYLFYRDSRQNIWVSLFRTGIDIFNSSGNTITQMTHIPGNDLSLSNRKVRSIVERNPGEVWLGTEGKGIDVIQIDDSYRIIKKVNYQFDPEDEQSLSYNDISVIFVASDGNTWVGTFGGGLNKFNPEDQSFTRINKENGLASNVVLTIEEDMFGNLWVGTGNGLCRIDRESNIQIFDTDDGLQDLEFTKGASYVNQSGELFFGGVNGYNRFHPDDVKKNNNIPPVVIDDFRLTNNSPTSTSEVKESSLSSKQLTLDYDQNDFSLDFVVLNFSQPDKNQYAYQLTNYDDDWIYTEDGYDITYTNVPPGNYTFKVKGANNDGIWNEEGATIDLVIRQPWYFSLPAVLMYLLIFGGFLIWSRKLIINRERLKNELQLEHLELKKTQEVSDLKSQFFANISHEFRTPLTLIIGPLKSLINGTYKGDHKNQFRIMARNADRLLRLINQILDLSKLESGSMGLKTGEQDMVKFLKPIAYAFTSYADRQFISYKCTFPEKKIPIYFDTDKVEKIVINLLSNALKYTPEFGKVNFNVEEDDQFVILKIADTGVGISERHLKYIFNRFYQVEDKHQKGTGIGLALTKELVDLHRGQIDVISKEDEGTIFTVKLPKGSDHLTEEEITGMEIPYQYEHTELSDIEIEIPAFNQDSETIKEDSDTGMDDLPVILVVEDNADMRVFICEYLVTNFKVLEASNGKEALDIAFEHIPDVIVSDIMMPEVSGYDLCEKVKKDDRTSHIPVILLTAKASGESTERGFELGADYYVTKPFNPKLLELRIRNILKTRDKIHHQLMNSSEVNLEPKNLNIGSKDQEFLNKIMACVEDNFANSSFGIDDLCKELGMSRTKLYRKLKGLIGQSANEFIRSFRLKRAAQLLRQQELTISEVTYQVGFNDLQYFRYCFKEQYGVNPSEYAQTAQ